MGPEPPNADPAFMTLLGDDKTFANLCRLLDVILKMYPP